MEENNQDSLDFEIEEIANYSNGQCMNDNKGKGDGYLNTSQGDSDKDDIDNNNGSTAFHLIEFHKKNITLNQKALEFLQLIEDDIIVVSIVGKARTGKSYLMNLLLSNHHRSSSQIDGFKVASTINSCTRGIWLWNCPKSQPNSTAKILFIDSEGTNSVDFSTKTYDSKIFALVVLISSLFIYNTTGNIDEKSISDLSLAAHISNSIACNSNIDKEALLDTLSPKFIWVLRDFTLDKINPETNEEISSNEYLELCLRNKSSGKNSNDNNIIREQIMKYFKERECITLSRPCESEEQLQKLTQIPFDELKPSFRTEFLELKNKIYKETSPKKVNGKRINGPALVKLLTSFVEAVNSGCVPNISNAWDSIIENDIKTSYDKAFKYYKDNLSHIDVSKMENDLFLGELYEMKYRSMMIYNKVIYINHDLLDNDSYRKIYENYQDLLSNDIDQSINNKKKVFKEMIISINTNQIDIDYKKIIDKIYRNSYNKESYFSSMMDEYSKAINKCSKGTNYCLELIAKKDSSITKDIVQYICSCSKEEYKKEENEIKVAILVNQKIQNMNMLQQLSLKNDQLKSKIEALVKEDTYKGTELSDLRERHDKILEDKRNAKYVQNNELMMSLRVSYRLIIT